MSCQVAPPANDATDPTAADTRYYREVLHELVAMSVDLARLVHATATTAEPALANPGLADATVAFDRIARAIRRTVGLARRLDEPAAPGVGHNRAAARRRIIREVEDAIQRQTSNDAPGREADALEDELFDRLDGPDLDADIDHRPVADIIADISRDLGLAAPIGISPWKRRTPDDIVALCARARQDERTPTISIGKGEPHPWPPGAPSGPIRPRPA